MIHYNKFSKSRDEIPSDLVNQSLELQRKVLNQRDQDLLDFLEVQSQHFNYALDTLIKHSF